MIREQGFSDLPAEDTGFLTVLLQNLQSLDAVNLGWFAGVIVALALLFAAGLRVPVRLAFASRVASAALVVAAALTVVILANVALFRHDAHLDLTREKAFTPSAEAREVVRGLREPIDIAYFLQKQNPGALALGTMLRQLERRTRRWPAARASAPTIRPYCVSASAALKWSPPMIVRLRSACCGCCGDAMS